MELADSASWPLVAATVTPDDRTTRRARVELAAALAAGVATQALFWRADLGLNLLLWTLVAIAAALASARPARITRTGYGLIAAAVLLALSFVRYAGDWTYAVAVPTDLLILAVLPRALRDEVDLGGLARLPLATLRTLRGTRRAAREAAKVPGVAVGGRDGGALQVAKGLALGLPVACLFVGLLSADADFAQVVGRLRERLGEGLSFTLWSLATGAGALVTHTVHGRSSGAGEPRRGEPSPYRHGAAAFADPAAPGGGRVESSTWTMVVGQVALVFALFAAVNLRGLFGGHALVRAPGSLTYAKYLHAGFGQLIVASALSIGLVVAGHRLLRPRGEWASSLPVPGGRLLVATEGSLLALTAVTVASCAQRLGIYEDAYGASRQRLGVAFILVGVLGALALTGAKVRCRGWTGHGGAVVALLGGLAVLASGVNADAYVARANLDRAVHGKALDRAYLASLSVDARGVLSHPVVRADPGLAATLRESYCHGRPRGDWRAIRGVGVCDR